MPPYGPDANRAPPGGVQIVHASADEFDMKSALLWFAVMAGAAAAPNPAERLDAALMAKSANGVQEALALGAPLAPSVRSWLARIWPDYVYTPDIDLTFLRDGGVPEAEIAALLRGVDLPWLAGHESLPLRIHFDLPREGMRVDSASVVLDVARLSGTVHEIAFCPRPRISGGTPIAIRGADLDEIRVEERLVGRATAPTFTPIPERNRVYLGLPAAMTPWTPLAAVNGGLVVPPEPVFPLPAGALDAARAVAREGFDPDSVEVPIAQREWRVLRRTATGGWTEIGRLVLSFEAWEICC
jgi:hypothetical protein